VEEAAAAERERHERGGRRRSHSHSHSHNGNDSGGGSLPLKKRHRLLEGGGEGGGGRGLGGEMDMEGEQDGLHNLPPLPLPPSAAPSAQKDRGGWIDDSRDQSTFTWKQPQRPSESPTFPPPSSSPSKVAVAATDPDPDPAIPPHSPFRRSSDAKPSAAGTEAGEEGEEGAGAAAAGGGGGVRAGRVVALPWAERREWEREREREEPVAVTPGVVGLSNLGACLFDACYVISAIYGSCVHCPTSTLLR
jgi:hypothetical protein